MVVIYYGHFKQSVEVTDDIHKIESHYARVLQHIHFPGAGLPYTLKHTHKMTNAMNLHSNSVMWAKEGKSRHDISFRMKNRCDIENTWFSFSSLFLVVFLFLFLCVASFLLHLHILHISLVCAPLVLDMWDRCHRILYIPLHIFWFWVVLLCTQPRHTITLRINCV